MNEPPIRAFELECTEALSLIRKILNGKILDEVERTRLLEAVIGWCMIPPLLRDNALRHVDISAANLADATDLIIKGDQTVSKSKMH